MSVILGIDIGGSTTKVAGFHASGERISMLQVEASDRLTSLYGAIGNFLSTNRVPLSEVSRFVLTGVGAALVDGAIYGVTTEHVDEFNAIGAGGLHLSGKKEALVVSLGTGTAFIRAGKDGFRHIGGSGVGGGTLAGLAWHLLHENDYASLADIAEKGDLKNVDLSIADICSDDISQLPAHTTASNFGRIRNSASNADIAMGLINMVFQTVGMLSVFALRNDPVRDAVLIGTLAKLTLAPKVLASVEELYDVRFFIPEDAVYATAIGAALPYLDRAE
ncbi:MAG TPA: type II pantothenate kinase [Clostridia bacterium]|nr:type II pantothenate kinase [Clostridia bacterium]